MKLRDQLPFCVFSSYDERTKTDFVKDATKQILKADSKVIVGTYVTPCLNGACDRKPSHWCSLDREGDDTFVLHSFLSYEHKPGTTCTEDCKPVIAACETPVLKAGNYTIKYQEKTYPLKIPSVLKAPCLKPD